MIVVRGLADSDARSDDLGVFSFAFPSKHRETSNNAIDAKFFCRNGHHVDNVPWAFLVQIPYRPDPDTLCDNLKSMVSKPHTCTA